MRYAFADFQLDAGQYQLRRGNERVHVEPLVFDLLKLFVQNPGRLIDRDRLMSEVWRGRIVSDATLSTAIKSARRALGESGRSQGLIETVRSRGFRFTGAVTVERAEAIVRERPDQPTPGGETGLVGRAPTVAVLPFTRLGSAEPYAGFEDAIPHEIILALSRLRSLSVIARGSTYQFRGPGTDVAAVGRVLGARYCLTGTLEIFGGRLAAGVELADAASGRVIWGERLTGALDDVHLVRSEIVSAIASALDSQVALNEALLAQTKPMEDLDAWQAFHLGLKHMHDYTHAGNGAAEACFRRAITMQPGFARAHAGLSFTHFQNAFMHYTGDREPEIEEARRSAERALELDPLDPFANLTMGRSLWLMKDLEAALPWMERATSISLSYAQGHYSRAMIDTMSGRSEAGLDSAGRAMALSPLDPLLYAMRAARALAHVTAGDYQQAASWAEAAARTPRAHVIIDLIAAASQSLAGNAELAMRWAATARNRKSDADRKHFFDGLPVQHAPTRRRISGALSKLGF